MGNAKQNFQTKSKVVFGMVWLPLSIFDLHTVVSQFLPPHFQLHDFVFKCKLLEVFFLSHFVRFKMYNIMNLMVLMVTEVVHAWKKVNESICLLEAHTLTHTHTPNIAMI